jgi:diguanylate cyclase (GGDEF)-like protein
MTSQENANHSKSFQRQKYLTFASFLGALGEFFKRAFDFIIALFGLIILSPLFILIARLIEDDTPGPIFYWGPRVGRNGRLFKMVKFRTMYENPESYKGPRLTSKGDSRITPVGSWLRDTKINELPQLWNVLIGDMSLVGPRPEDPEIAKSWPEDERSKIMSVRPGITSPASILYHDEEKLLSQKGTLNEYYKSILPEKIRLDLLYVRHHSFFSDLDSIFWTLFIFIPRWSKLELPEARFFAGPVSRIANRYISWFIGDLIVSLGVIGGCALIWRSQFPLNWGVKPIIFLGVLLALLFSGVNSIAGLNRISWTHATAEDAVGLILSNVLVTGLILGLNYLLSIYQWLSLPPLPTLMIIVIGLLSGASFIIIRYRLRLLTMITKWWLSIRRNTLILGERVLVVGDGEAGQIASWLLSRPLYRTAFSIVGVVNDNDPTKNGMRINGYWMLGGVKDMPAIIKRQDVGVILSALPATAREANEYIFDLCQSYNIRLIFFKDLMLMIDRQVTQPIGSYEYPIWLDERLEFKAMHDSITGLPNRYLFQDRLKLSLSYARRYKSRLAVMFIRVERKNIDTSELGRKYDDEILIEVARRLTKSGRGSDTLAYIGKNKFAVILENIVDEGTPALVAKRILGVLSEPIKVEHFDFQLHTSIDIEVCMDAERYSNFETRCRTEIEMQYVEKQETEALGHYDSALGK